MAEAILDTFTDTTDLDTSFLRLMQRFKHAKDAEEMRRINNALETVVKQLEATL